MRQTAVTLRPPFPFFVGIISVVTFPFWLLVVVIDVLGWRPSTAPLDYLWLGGVFWLVSIFGASPALFFRLRFLENHLQFRWFGYPTKILPYSAIEHFEFPAFSFGGLRLHLANGSRDVYWVDHDETAELLRHHGVQHMGVA
jgi:hypothetical protein